MADMDYTQLIPEYANFLLITGATFAITSAIAFVLIRLSNSSYNDPLAASIISLVVAFVLSVSCGYTAGWAVNRADNLQIVKDNVEAKYDVAVSNVEKVTGDDDAYMFSAAIISTKDHSARDVTLLITNDGTPSIMDTDSFKAETVKR